MSGKIILLDTNAIGQFLDNPQFIKKFTPINSTIILSIISKLEFLSNPQLTVKHKFVFESFIETIQVYPIATDDLELIRNIVLIRKKYKLKLPDSIIAATAIVNDATLISGDDSFAKIYGLKFILLK